MIRLPFTLQTQCHFRTRSTLHWFNARYIHAYLNHTTDYKHITHTT